MTKLTDKQEEKPLKPEWIVFAHEYVIDWNRNRAYRVAYPKGEKTDETVKVNACKLLTNANLQIYIAEIQKDLAKLAGVSALLNINRLTEILDSETKSEQEGEDGEKITTKSESTKDRIAALKVLNDMLGYNAPVKKDIRVDDNRMSPEEREKRIKALQDKAKKDAE